MIQDSWMIATSLTVEDALPLCTLRKLNNIKERLIDNIYLEDNLMIFANKS
jgi:hypothetical protein